MDEVNTRDLAWKLLEFNFRLGHWRSQNYDREFNINGKGSNALTSRQFSILFLVSDGNALTISKMEKVLGISKSSLSLTVSKLVKEGYLERNFAEGKDDKRKVYFKITEKGINTLKTVAEKVIDTFDAFYKTLNERQRQDLEIGIEKLSSIFQ